MRLHHFGILVALVVLAAGFGVTGEPAKDAAVPTQLAIQFHNGTLIKDAVVEGTIEIMTRYGKFTIPSGDIRRIEFGFRLQDEEARKLDVAMVNLQKDNFELRESATRDLVALGRLAVPALTKAAKVGAKELDTTQRIDKVLQEIRKAVPSDQMKYLDDDVIHTADATLRGKIMTNILKAKAGVLGDLALPLAQLRFIRTTAGHRVVRIEPSAMEPWVETDVELPAGARISIKVTGSMQMELGGRKLAAGPQGSEELMNDLNRRVGHNVNQPVGLLHGRVMKGDSVSDFTIGNRYEGVINDGGKLALKIYTGAPHDFPVRGAFTLEIEIE